MRYFINSILLASLAKIWTWAGIFLLGFITGIILYAFWILLNPGLGIVSFSVGTINNGTFWGIAGIAAAKISKILLIALICLLITSNKYGIAAGKIVILLLSVFLGFVSALFIKSAGNDYLGIAYLVVPVFSILWTLSIGNLKTDFMTKCKLAVMPVSLAGVVSLYRVFL